MPLPAGFTLGTITSAVAAEGAAPASDWAGWERKRRAAPSGEGNGWRSRYPEDAALLAEHGLGAHVVTVDWARLEPAAGRIDGLEVERVRAQLSELRSAGVAPWACLFHTTLPGWFDDEGGFADDKARGAAWARWVDVAAQSLGDLVDTWLPLHDPVGWAWDGLNSAVAPPGRQDAEAMARAVRGTVPAWRAAWRALRGGGPKVAWHVRLLDLHTADTTVPARQHVRLLDELLWGTVVAAQRDGLVSVPGLAEEQWSDLAGSGDLIAITAPGALAVADSGAFHPYPAAAKVDDLGWGRWPEGLGHVLRRAAELLPNRTFGGHDAHWGLFDRDRNPRPVVAVLSEAVAASAPAVIEPDPDPDAQERPR